MKKVRSLKLLIISLILPFIAGGIGSLATYPAISGWYAGLTKPFFSPPNWLFGPVWTLLYILMGISLYLVWVAKTKRSKRHAFILFGLQLVLNTLWSVVFFGLQQPFMAVAVIILLLLALISTAVAFWPISRVASYLLFPYIAWVSFAMALNISLSILNPGTESITNYTQCASSNGSRLLLVYPAVCVTRSGKSFTNTQQHLPTQNVLAIKEWKLELTLTDQIADAYYTYDASTSEVYLTSSQLEDLRDGVQGCKSGLHGLYFKYDNSKLTEQGRAETMCMPTATSDTQKINQIKEQLRAAAKSATAAN